MVSMCPTGQHCSKWAEAFCVCNNKQTLSLALGLASVLTWGVAEIPQIITNYNQKSTEGLSLAFQFTWLLGDFLNLIGCKLEPATLPTQFCMAVLYTLTSLALVAQSLYYGHIYHRLKSNRQRMETETVVRYEQRSNDIHNKQVEDTDEFENRNGDFSSGFSRSSPIPLPSRAHSGSSEGELYYTSARSLSRSHTPTVGFHMQRRRSSIGERTSLEEPLIAGHVSTRSSPASNIKTMLCMVSAMTFFLSIPNLQLEKSNRNMVFEKQNRGFVVQAGRHLLQVSGSLLKETGSTERSKIGSFLGWGMAAIYMGGRLPQIVLNFRRGNVQGLNPLMFVFALIGNGTYVASILVSSMDWSKIEPNLPWLVDAGGCVVLDTLILIQFVYFHFRLPQDIEVKHGHSNIT